MGLFHRDMWKYTFISPTNPKSAAGCVCHSRTCAEGQAHHYHKLSVYYWVRPLWYGFSLASLSVKEGSFISIIMLPNFVVIKPPPWKLPYYKIFCGRIFQQVLYAVKRLTVTVQWKKAVTHHLPCDTPAVALGFSVVSVSFLSNYSYPPPASRRQSNHQPPLIPDEPHLQHVLGYTQILQPHPYHMKVEVYRARSRSHAQVQQNFGHV